MRQIRKELCVSNGEEMLAVNSGALQKRKHMLPETSQSLWLNTAFLKNDEW